MVGGNPCNPQIYGENLREDGCQRGPTDGDPRLWWSRSANRLQRNEPLPKLRAGCPHPSKSYVESSEDSEQRLIVRGGKNCDPLGRGGIRSVINVLRSVERIANRLKGMSGLRLIDRTRKQGAIAEQQTFEFVHDDERDKSASIEILPHLGNDIGEDSVLNRLALRTGR